jgi:hypothetical protein
MLCESFLRIPPHWGLWRQIFFVHHNASTDALHDIGGAIIYVCPKAEYFNFKMADSIQNWRTKWCYINNEQTSEAQMFGLAPFDPKKEVKKLKSWDQALFEAELGETEPLIARIKALQDKEKKELLGVQIITHFL